ncbi:MAG: tetraacyldisaccharide 4'-kinase [Candidatus Omnitrophota bacterium]
MIFRKILFLFYMPFSFIYYFLVFLRNVFYGLNIFRKHKINAKVVSVGNITWGGTGKTPVVAFIADLISKRNHRAAILIRGYGNDESELLPKLATNAHVFVGKDRVKTGREAIEHGLADTIILDDGFQYRRLKRDLNIVCIDATNPFGNGWVIPAGSMREGKRSLKRADIFLITKSDLVSEKEKVEKLEKRLKTINPRALTAKAIHRPLYFYRLSKENSVRRSEFEKVNIGELQNRELVLVSAIGSPECFEKTIQRLGLKINKHFVFRDHHLYTKDDIARVEEYCRKNSLTTVVTTEKDAVKLKGQEWMVLKVRLEIIENEDGFSNRLFGIYNS